MFAAGEASAKEVVFRNVNVVPMVSDEVLTKRDVVVRDGLIVSVGGRAKAAPGAQIIDGGGRLWLSPGLADMHVHSDTRDDLSVYLANGITTIANMGDARSSFVGRTTMAVAASAIPGPQIFNALVIDGSVEYGHLIASTPEQAAAVVSLAKSNGYHFIKVYNNLSPDVFTALAAEAKKQGIPVVGHGLTKVGLKRQLEEGQVLVAHAEEFFYTFFSAPGTEQTDEPPPDARINDAIELVLRSGAAVGADLVAYGAIMRSIGHPEIVEACLRLPSSALVSPSDRLAWRRSPYFKKSAKLALKYQFLQKMLKAMADRNVELLAGTDAPTIPCVAPGSSLHDNLAELEPAGLSRFQALSTATRLPGAFIARTIGGPRFGVIVPGARADLILSRSNPLKDLSVLRAPVGVMAGGAWRDSDELHALTETIARAYAAQ